MTSTRALFRKASAYCSATYDSWFALSAKHGLLHPYAWVEPYDLTLNAVPQVERRRWAEQVLAEIERLRVGGSAFSLHACERY